MSNFYGATGLIGGTAGKLDAIDGAILAEGDGAVVIIEGTHYQYFLDANSGASESSPDIIAPDSNPGDKRWTLCAAHAPGVDLVDRGDPATSDYDLTGFTRDGAWYDWDLSGVVPAGVSWVLLNISWSMTSGNDRMQIRKNGNSNAYNLSTVRTQVANIRIDFDVWVAVDANRVIEYNITNGATFFGTNVATVKGWLI